MADISELLARKSAQDEARTAERQADRANLSEMRSAGVEVVTTDPAMYQKFLTLQADNMWCSPGNVVLSLLQLDGCTHIGSLAYWHDQGRYVKDEAIKEGAKVFVPPHDPRRRGYFMGEYYDVSQTSGKPIKEPVKLEEGGARMEAALTALLNTSPVPLRSDPDIPTAAYYDPDKLEIAVNPDSTNTAVFAALATEIAYAYFHDRGRNTDFDRESCTLDAQSVGYMVCRRFGVDQPVPKAEDLDVLYDGFGVEDREKELNHLCTTARNIADKVDRAIQPRQQEHSRKHQPAR